jgi:hypothetical protein
MSYTFYEGKSTHPLTEGEELSLTQFCSSEGTTGVMVTIGTYPYTSIALSREQVSEVVEKLSRYLVNGYE